MTSERITSTQGDSAQRVVAEDLAALLDAVPVMIWAAAPDGTCTYLSPAWLNFTGQTMEEAQGDGWMRAVHPDDLSDRLAVYRGALRREVDYRMDYRLRTADGEYRWVTDAGVPRYAPDGRFMGFVGSCMDISEQKQVEAALRESEELKNRIIASSRDCIKVLDLEGRLLSMSAGGQQLLEIKDLTPLLDQSWADVWPPEFQPVVREAVDVARLGEVGSFVGYCPTESGTPKWWEVVVTPVLDSSGHPDRLLAISRDVSDRVTAEAALRRSESEYRAIFELSSVAMGQADCATARILRVNRKFCQLLGYSAEELCGMCVRDITHPEDIGFNLELLDQARRGEIDTYSLEKRYIRKDGKVVWVQLDSNLLRTADGELHTLTVMQDITERKHAEQALRETTEQLQVAEQIARSGSWDLNIASGAIRWSKGMYALLSREPDFVPDMATALTLIPEYDRQRVETAVQKALDEKTEYRLEHDIERGDGEVLTVQAVARIFSDADGAPVRMLGTLVDITERKRAAHEREELLEQLRLERARLEEILRQMPAGVFIAEAPSGRLVLGNRQAAEIWRHPFIACNDIKAYDEYKCFHPDGRPYEMLEWPLARALTYGEVISGEEMDIQRFDGTRGSITASAAPVRAPDGRIVAAVATIYDTTERHDMEAALRESEARFRALVETVPDILYRAKLPGYVTTYISLANKDLVGFSGDEWLASPELWSSQVHPDDRARVHRELDRQIASGNFYSVEYRFRHRDGKTLRWFRDHGRVERDADGTATALFGVMSDITDHKRIEEALQDADRRKDRFLATLAHELRNPLTPISNALHLIRRRATDPKLVATALGIAERQMAQLIRLVDDLLDMSRVTHEKIVLQKTRVSLETIVQAALETSQPQIEAAGHEFALELPEQPIYLEADTVRLAQALSNLLLNAAKFTDPGGRIRLVARREGSAAVIDVEDSGIGLPASELPRVFDLFAQIEHPAKQLPAGLGIGLALVKSLIELHGGSVAAFSPGIDQGSTFSLRLPLSEQPEPSQPPQPLQVDAGKNRRRILVVDDDTDVARSITMLLQTYGHDVYTAYEGAAAIETACRIRPEVVLLDIGMPGMSGYEVARRLRERPELRGTRLIALTGWGQEEDRRRSKEAGFDHHLVKPVDPRTLAQLLEDAHARGDMTDSDAG